ncbi:universal stress protein [soil metagenome]
MKVLIALDDSECSNLAFDSLAERIWPELTEFRIITVVEPAYIQAPPFGGVYSAPMIEAQIEFEKYCRERVKEKVETMKSRFPKNAVSGETLLGPVAELIIDEAKAWNADLIIVGSHGRKGFGRFFLGSVAERVAGHAPCSVEIVKHKLVSQEEIDKSGKETSSTKSLHLGGKVLI